MALRLAEQLELPRDAATQTYGFIARKGGGKTYAAGKLVEELLALDVPVIVIDPIGNWYGLQIARDGKGEGFRIPVFGGARANVPVLAGQGDALARLIASRNLSAVIDVSSFRKNERKRFVADFAESLFHEIKTQPAPRLVVFEEAQVFAPQRAGSGNERLLGAVEDIVRLGRNYGLGSALISQRPQSVNKEVLNQVEALFVGQLSGPQERKTIADWVTERGADRRLLEELPGLEPGTMVVWSPQWLRLLRKVKIGRKRTFDASATPVLGKQRAAQPRASTLDVDELRCALSALAEPTPKRSVGKADSVRLAMLDAELAKLRAREVDREQMTLVASRISTALQALQQLTAELMQLLAGAAHSAPAAVPEPVTAPVVVSPRAPAQPRSPRAKPSSTASRPLRAGAMRMLTALATFHPGVMTRPQIARAAGLRVTSGTFSTYWSELRQQGYLEDAGAGLFRATDRGLAALGSARPTVPQTFAERRAFWEARLRAGERRLLEFVVAAGDAGISREELAARAQMSVTSGTFSTYLSTLSNNRLITRVGSQLAVHAWLLRGPVAP